MATSELARPPADPRSDVVILLTDRIVELQWLSLNFPLTLKEERELGELQKEYAELLK